MGVINYTTAKINELLDKIDKAPDTIENGKTPVFVTGTTTTLDPGLSATAEVVQDGVDENGNPKYKINFGVPKGLDGASGEGGGGTADSVQWGNILNMPSWVNSATKPTYTASEVGALPADTTIPSKTSQLTNDSNFLTSSDFKTINGQPIVGSGNIQIEGGSSGGTGNVNVTNASSLRSARLYSFKPSVDGSLIGTFQEIPNANENAAGLLSSVNYSKLVSIKSCVYLPIAFEQVNSSTSKEELVQLFSKAFKLEDLDFAQLVVILATYSTMSDSDGNGDSGGKFFIGNNDCLFRGLYTEAENKLLTEFTYIVIGGKLKTISILFSNLGASDPSEVNLSISITESGDDVYYMNTSLLDMNALSTAEEIYNAAGGYDGVNAIKKAIRKNKRIIITDNIMFFYPVISSMLFFAIDPHISILDPYNNIIKTFDLTNANPGACEVHIFYLQSYTLSDKVYSLSDSSSSLDIDSAVGGENGLKKIIKAVKDGNRLKITGELGDVKLSTDLLVWSYVEAENGDLMISFSGVGYALFGKTLNGMIVINFTKSTNEFSVQIITI